MTICVILVGFTLNSQNLGISAETTSLDWTQNAQLTNSIIIGHASVNSAGATAAIQNTGFGVNALKALKRGDKNTAVGFKAGNAISGANGQGAGGADSGTGNTLVGNASGYQIAAGEFNTALGNQTASNLVGGDYNTYIGSGAGGGAGSGAAQNRTALGQGVTVTADNTAVIGKAATTKVYFGSESYAATLYATGINLENDETITNATDGTVVVSGNLTVSSDMRLKDNIQPLGDTMVNILKLDAKSYTREGREEIGLIAQDVQSVYPELVVEDGNGMLAVNYQALSAILINGIKDQEARIQKLELLVKLLLEDK